jgi:DNA polymerase-4
MTSVGPGSQQAERERKGTGRRRVILHADMDAFYASIEQRDRPELRGRPVIVGGTSNRGVVSAASYEARRFGVHSAMPAVIARRRCPEGVFLRGDMKKYAAVSRQVFEVFRAFSPDVEGISLDEAFLDLTGTERLHGPAVEAGHAIRAAVREATRLAVSVGIAPSKLVAKIASDEAKPDGLLEVRPEEVLDFLRPLPVERLWGVGPVTRERLRAEGLYQIGDLEKQRPERLAGLLGEIGSRASELSQGRDARDVESDRAPVSMSEENTFGSDQDDWEQLANVVRGHAESVSRRLRRSGWRARTVVLKVKYAMRVRSGPRGFHQITRRRTLRDVSDDGAALGREAVALLLAVPRQPVRLIGVGVTGLLRDAGPAQLDLLERVHDTPRAARLNRAMDSITERFGADAVKRAGSERGARAGLSLQHKHGESED